MKWNTTFVVLIVLVLVGCGTVSGDQNDEREREFTDDLMNEQAREIGMPNIDNFFEKRMAKRIYEVRDNSELTTYAYNMNLHGKYIYLGRAVGFGLPYSTQYTRPEKIVQEHMDSFGSVSRADPNGLYMPDGVSATWLLRVNPQTGEEEVIYTEPRLVVTQSKLPSRLVANWSVPEGYENGESSG